MRIEELFSRPADLAELDPERRIILSALDCIAELGLEGATVRDIASRAGLNAASVNYYFRSKDRLVEEALREAWHHVTEDIASIMAKVRDRDEAASTVTRFLVEGAWRYPRLIRAIVVEHPTLSGETAGWFRELFRDLALRFDLEPEGALGSVLLVGFAMLLGYAPKSASIVAGLDLADAAARERISERLALLLFAQPPRKD
jgi:AcrR family transcriptional regulator